MTSPFKTLSLILVCVSGVACIEGDYPEGEPVGSSVAFTSKEAGRFLGAWRYVAGSYGSLCEGETLHSGDVPLERITFRAGAGPAALIVRDQEGCEVTCTVQGTVARGQPGAVCPLRGTTIARLDYELEGESLRAGTSYVARSLNAPACNVVADGVLVRE